MANPITWQNVSGPSLADAGRPLEAASRNFTGMFDGLSAVLKQREATGDANYKQEGVNNTNAMYGAIQEAATPEEYAAREAQLRQQLLGYGANVDSVAVRNSMDNRLATLQTRAKAGEEYKNFTQDVKDAPARDLASSLYAQGRFAEGDAEAAKVQRNKAALYEASRVGQRRVTTEGQADTTFANGQAAEAQKVLERPYAIQALQDAHLNSASTRSLQEAHIKELNAKALAEHGPIGQAKRAESLYKERLANSPLDAGTMDTEEGRKNFMAELGKLSLSQNEKDDVVEQFSKQLGGGIEIGRNAEGKSVKIGVPVSAAIAAITSSDENALTHLLPYWSRRGDDAVNKFQERIAKDKDYMAQLASAYEMQGNRLYPLLTGQPKGTITDPRDKPLDYSGMGTGGSTPKK